MLFIHILFVIFRNNYYSYTSFIKYTVLVLNFITTAVNDLFFLKNLWARLFKTNVLQGARRREFRYIHKPGNPSKTRGRAY